MEKQFGPYQILAPLGAGGMGEVYRAKDTRLHREVAFKILSGDSSSNPERQRRFEQEARAASALNHPNILTVYDVGSENGHNTLFQNWWMENPCARLFKKVLFPLRDFLKSQFRLRMD